MKISFLICTHNEESKYLEPLFNQIGDFCIKTGNEFVILDDISDKEETKSQLQLAHEKYNAKIILHPLYDGTEYHFGRHKTVGSRACLGEWIFLIDGDEILSPDLLENLSDILDSNKDVELIKVPRLNEVIGMTDEDVVQWGWRVSEFNGKKYINFCDYQHRIYKNSPLIFWKNRLHEVIDGAKVISEIPALPELSIIHIKTIDRQRTQNMFYNKNFSVRENKGHI
jgi:glycosyltransferase involved in cell wall biosynthesis